MSKLDRCLERLAHLERADRLLNEVRIYAQHGSVYERLAQHRILMGEARRHLDSARAVGHD